METISCNSNQSSYLTIIKNITFVEGNVLFKYAKFQLHPLYSFLEEEFLIFFFKFTLYVAPQPIKLSDLDKSRMKRGGLLNKHFSKKKIQISQMTWQILSFSTFPIISLWKL